MNAAQRLLVPLLLPLAAGCTAGGAVFVTKTSLSVVDIDGTPPEATFGVNRVEGFIAPRNQNGDTPPVLAHLQSDRGFFEPNIQQVYATGTAAERLADGDTDKDNSNCSKDDCPQDDSKGRPLTFVTSTNIGIRLGLGSHVTSPVDGLVFGYRRKEMSFVPILAKDKNGTYRYPSLIAAIRLTGPNADAKGFRSCHGFATGTAASLLATKDDAGFGCLEDNKSVRQMLTSKDGVELRQQAEITAALRCYSGLAAEQKKTAREHAEWLGLLAAASGTPQTEKTAAAGGDLKLAAYALADEDSRYAMRLIHGTVPPAKATASEGAAPARAKGEGAMPLRTDAAAPQGSAAASAPAAQEKANGSSDRVIVAMLREHLLRQHRKHVCATAGEGAK